MGNVIWRYRINPWRKFCGRWWRHLFDLRLLWLDIVDAKDRALHGWASGDIFDMVSYHSGVTLGMLEHYKKNHCGYSGESQEEYEAKLDLAIDAWRAKCALVNDEGLAEAESYEKWRKPLERRWKNGITAFLEIYDSLWN